MSSAEKPAPSFLTPLVAQRREVAFGLVVAGAVLASLAIWWGVWGFARSGERAAKADGKVVLDDIGKSDPAAAEDARPNHSPDYQIACLWAGGLAVLALLSAGWVYTQAADPTAPLTAARTEVVAFGGITGLWTTLFGALLGYRWYPSVVRWVGSKDATEAQWVLYAVAVFLAGLLIMFASLQLARTEERANASLRRVLYGFNSVFMGLLLLLVMVVVNVFVFIQVPTTLVTNESAFNGLSDESKRFLHSLDRPVHVYLMLPESHAVALGRGLSYNTMYADCRGLLTACEAESPNFHALFLSPAFDKDRIAALFQRLKVEKEEGDREQYGMLVTVGEDEEARIFIRDMETISADQGNLVFQAESRLMTELAYMADARGKEKVYFTQGHGELAFDGGGEAGDKSMSSMIQFLRDRKFTVEALPLDAPGAKVPDDAAVVVVAGLRRFVGPEDPMFGALRDYVRRVERPGKLFLCLPAFRKEGTVSPNGLEPLLTELGVDVEAGSRLLSMPGQYRVPAEYVLVASAAGLDPELSRIVRGAEMMVRDTRPVRPAPAPPGGPRRVNLLLGTNLVTWQESDYSKDPTLHFADMRSDRQMQQQKKLSPRPVAVAAAVIDTAGTGEKTTKRPRALIFGTDTFLQDQSPIPSGAEEYRQLLLADGIDWLRERNATVGITPRKVGVFNLEKRIEWTSQAVLLAMVSIGITSLGVGVWLSRRR